MSAEQLHSHTLTIDDSDEEDIVAVEELHEKEYRIRVAQSPGYLCKITATAIFNTPADVIWEQCIVHPDNQDIYSHMDRCVYRKIIPSTDTATTKEEDNDEAHNTSTHNTAQHRRIEVAHEASWRFLFWHGKFTTRLLVLEDHQRRIMKFTLLPSQSILSKFEGTWRVTPDAEDEARSISVLEQDIALGVWLPPPIDIILKKISAGQVRKIFDDIQQEVENINSGKPTLCPYILVKDKEIM